MMAMRYARHQGVGSMCLVLAPKLARMLGAQTGDVVRIEPMGDGTFRLIPAGALRPSWAHEAMLRFRSALGALAGRHPRD